MAFVFLFSICFNFEAIKTLALSKTKDVIPLFSLPSYFFYFGMGTISKIFSPFIPIFSLAAVLINLKIKNKRYRMFTIMNCSVLLITGILLSITVLQIDYLNYFLPNSALTDLNDFLKIFAMILIAIHPAFIIAIVQYLLQNMLIADAYSPLIEVNLNYYCKKLLLTVLIIGITAYWWLILS